ncbi:amino acid ABC transporter permease [Pseudonocardia sp. TRM90224]|uniref:amino acid ABC transporter permease n=1 Tax=Pseudonocardia sp. TRM90224 TaxID=2812678 RepID=UPI001E52C265|nr:amino acid ABC transporter permease [Pseudonocardia sp. TRM90224]
MQFLQAVLLGVPMTLLITLLAFAVGAVLGVPLVLARRSALAPVRVAARLVIDVLRGIPPVVFLFVIYYGVGTDVIKLNALQAAVIGLGLIAAGYMAEIYRGGLLAVHKGQFESAAALGMSHWTALSRIIGPQAVRVALPSATTYAIGLLKDSSIASTITATEILYRAESAARGQGAPLEPFLIAAVVYIALGAPLAWLSRTMDAKMRARVAK